MFKSAGSIGTSPIPKDQIEEEIPGATIETEFNHSKNNVEEPDNIEHIELEEIECDISAGEKSQETSKIYKLMETVRENVLFKNPLNKV